MALAKKSRSEEASERPEDSKSKRPLQWPFGAGREIGVNANSNDHTEEDSKERWQRVDTPHSRVIRWPQHDYAARYAAQRRSCASMARARGPRKSERRPEPTDLELGFADPAPGRPPGEVRIGPAGWAYSDWAGIVYPSRKRRDFHEASFLAQYFDTIEINTSFYQPVQPDLTRQWIDRVAENPRFQFTAKLWRKFTHEIGATAEDERAARAGFDLLRDAGKLGAVLLQFPFSFHRMPDTLSYLDELMKRFSDYPLVVEVRHGSWNDKEFYGLLRERGVGFCNIDQPVIGKSLKPTGRTTAEVGYIRLHGRRYDTWFSDDPDVPMAERYNYFYTQKELEPWADRIRKLAGHAQTTFVVTNNHYQGKSVVNALQLISLLTGNKVKVPEPLRHHYPELEQISSEPPQEPMLFPDLPRARPQE